MRRVRYKVCGERWHPRMGTVFEFYKRHIEMHGLVEPVWREGETEEEFAERCRRWRMKYFEDSIYEGEEA